MTCPPTESSPVSRRKAFTDVDMLDVADVYDYWYQRAYAGDPSDHWLDYRTDVVWLPDCSPAASLSFVARRCGWVDGLAAGGAERRSL